MSEDEKVDLVSQYTQTTSTYSGRLGQMVTKTGYKGLPDNAEAAYVRWREELVNHMDEKGSPTSFESENAVEFERQMGFHPKALWEKISELNAKSE